MDFVPGKQYFQDFADRMENLRITGDRAAEQMPGIILPDPAGHPVIGRLTAFGAGEQNLPGISEPDASFFFVPGDGVKNDHRIIRADSDGSDLQESG